MPPKDEKAAEQAQKQFKKQLEEARYQQLDYNTKEYARLNKVRLALLQHWQSVAEYLFYAQKSEKERLAAESKEFGNFLRNVGRQYNQEVRMFEHIQEWEYYLKKEIQKPAPLIASLDVLLNAVKPDSTVQALQMLLAENDSIRPFVEQKENLYYVFLTAVQEITKQMLKLQKISEILMPTETYKQKLLANNQTMQMQVSEEAYGDILKITDLKLVRKDYNLFSIFTARSEFQAVESCERIVDATLKNELFKPNATPKCQEFDDKMNLIVATKQGTQKIEVYEQKAAYAEQGGRKRRKAVYIPNYDAPDMEIYLLADIFSARSDNFKRAVYNQFGALDDALYRASELPIPDYDEEMAKDEQARDELYKQRYEVCQELRQALYAALVDKCAATYFVTKDELAQIQQAAVLQSNRVLLRAYLFNFMDLAAKTVIENCEVYGDVTDTIKLCFPAFERADEISEQSNNEETEEGEDEYSMEEQKYAGGLNFENLQKLNEHAKSGDIATEAQEEIMDFESKTRDQERLLVKSEGDDDQDEYDRKYCSFRNNRVQYNKDNITSINEVVAVQNHQRLYPSIRQPLALQYVILKANGEFLEKATPDMHKLLCQIVRTDKQYYLSTNCENYVFFEPLRYKIPYLTQQERQLLAYDKDAQDLKPVDRARIEKLQEQLEAMRTVNRNELHSQVFAQGLILTASQGKGKTIKHSFTTGFKVVVPGVLSMSNLAVRVSIFAANLTGNSVCESFENVQFNCLPRDLDMRYFYPYQQIQCQGDSYSLMNLVLQVGVYEYLKRNVYARDEEYVGSIEVDQVEKLNGLMHPNIQRLFEQRTRLKVQIYDFRQELIALVRGVSCSSIYSLQDTQFLDYFVVVMMGIQFLQAEYRKMDFLVVREHFRLTRLAQAREAAAQRGRKAKAQLAEAQLRQNCDVLRYYAAMLHCSDRCIKWIAQALDDLRDAQAQAKSKSKNKFVIPTCDELIQEVRGQTAEATQNNYKTPQIVPVSDSFHVDALRVAQTAYEVNGWAPRVLLGVPASRARKNHAYCPFEDMRLDEYLAVESTPTMPLSRPVKDQIRALRDALRAKHKSAQPRKVQIDEHSINSTVELHATTFVAEQQQNRVQAFYQICMQHALLPVQADRSHISDYYARKGIVDRVAEFFDVAEAEDKKKQFAITKQMYMQLTPYVDYFIFPTSTTQSYNTYPGFNMLQIAYIAAERARFSVFDSVLFWNYATNDNAEQLSVVNPSATGDEQDKSNQHIQVEVYLSDELRAGIHDILQPYQAIQYLYQAFLFYDYSSLLGTYFVGFWNANTQTYDPDGVSSIYYRPDYGVLSVRLLKTGVFAICAIKQAHAPFRAWAALSDAGRGEGYTIQAAAEEFLRFVGDSQNNGYPNLSITGSATVGQSTQIDIRQAAARYTRFSYFMPFQILARSGRPSDVPTQMAAQDLIVPQALYRAIQLNRERQVYVHSVVMRLLLPSRVLLSIRVLPEGYEIIDIADMPRIDVVMDNAVDYVAYDEFVSQIKNYNYESVPKSLKQLVFTTIPDLFSATRKCGILLVPLTDFEIRQLGFEPKAPETEVEFARQLSIALCCSTPNSSLHHLVTSSPWNRKLCKEVLSYPKNNQFYTLQDEFDMSGWMIRGRLPPEEIENYRNSELKRLKKEKRDMKTWMKEQRSTDEKAARKAVTTKVEQKVEKGAPPPLGPAFYGMKTEAVEKRSKAIADILAYINEYLSAVDLIRQVQKEQAACFVVHTDKLKIDLAAAELTPLQFHQRYFESLQLPAEPGPRPELPKTAAELKQYAKLEKKMAKLRAQQQENQAFETENVTVRCSQTQPFAEEQYNVYTVTVNKTSFGSYTVRASQVPVAGPASEKEEFCNVSVDGTTAHADVLGVLGVHKDEARVDCVLLGKVFELVCYLRLGSLG